MSEIQGRVKKLSIDQKTGDVYGFILDDVDGYFNYSKLEYRDLPWDEHPVDSIIKVKFNSTDQGKRFVKSIERCDGETEPPWLSEEDGPAHTAIKEKKAAVVKEVLAGEQGRNQSIERQVAMKCAAEVAAAAIAAAPGEADHEVLSALIDVCLDKFLAATK